MNEQQLDEAYTALCHALAEAGEANAQRLLAMVCLALMARSEQPRDVLDAVEQARRALAAGGGS